MNRIKKLREEFGLSLKSLEDELSNKYDIKVSRSSLNKYERGEQEPKLALWDILGNIFAVDTAYVMGLTPIRNQEENKMYEDSFQILKNLVEENTDISPTIRTIVISIANLCNNNKDNEETILVLSQFIGTLDFFDSVDLDLHSEYIPDSDIKSITLAKVKYILQQKNFMENLLTRFIDTKFKSL